MNKTTIRISQFTQDRLRDIAGRKGMSVSQLINEISLRYIGAEEGAQAIDARAARGRKDKAKAALQKLKKSTKAPLPGDELT